MTDSRFQIIQGDVIEVLRTLPDEFVHCCVTSPPYWGLRDYGTGTWEGGDPACDHKIRFDSRADRPLGKLHGGHETIDAATAIVRDKCPKCGARRLDKQIGLEHTVDEYVAKMVGVFSEVRRVLRPDGTLWLNLGDSYCSTIKGSGGHSEKQDSNAGARFEPRHIELGSGLKPKDLAGVPWRTALALQADGWWLRSDIIWCLSGGTCVYARTQKREMPVMIKDLVRLDPKTVRLWNGCKWTQVLGWSRSTDQSEKLEVVLRSGQRIGCTGSHLWPTQRGDVAARDLVVGDVLASCRLPEPAGASVPPYLTDDSLWMIGLYLAEGSKAGDTLQLALNADELGWVSRLESIAKYYGGSCTHTVDGNTLAVRLYGKTLNGIINTYIGLGDSHTQHLGVAAWSLPNRALAHIASGYLAGDGSSDPNWDRIRLGFCRNYALERDLRVLAARLGATLTLKPVMAKNQTGYHPAFRGEWRWTRNGHWNEKDRSEVVAVRASRARQFWDISVEDEPHVFALASGVLTHNCKPNAMPESVTDRPTKSHEYMFLLAKSDRYYYDGDAIKEECVKTGTPGHLQGGVGERGGTREGLRGTTWDPSEGRNRRSVWSLPTYATPEAHFATYPVELPELCIRAGTPQEALVLDPFSGAATTGLACLKTGRRYLGIELNPEYIGMAFARARKYYPLLLAA